MDEITEKERYQRYLCSREWGVLKQQVKTRSGRICERCKMNPSDAVHHLTYERKYNEKLEDLQDTCDACHKFTHGLSDLDPIEERRGQIGYYCAALYVILSETPDFTLRCFSNDKELVGSLAFCHAILTDTLSVLGINSADVLAQE